MCHQNMGAGWLAGTNTVLSLRRDPTYAAYRYEHRKTDRHTKYKKDRIALRDRIYIKLKRTYDAAFAEKFRFV